MSPRPIAALLVAAIVGCYYVTGYWGRLRRVVAKTDFVAASYLVTIACQLAAGRYAVKTAQPRLSGQSLFVLGLGGGAVAITHVVAVSCKYASPGPPCPPLPDGCCSWCDCAAAHAECTGLERCHSYAFVVACTLFVAIAALSVAILRVPRAECAERDSPADRCNRGLERWVYGDVVGDSVDEKTVQP